MADRNKAAAEARRRRNALPPPPRELLLSTYRRHEDLPGVDITGWWRDADVLARLGPALAELFTVAEPTIVVAPQSRGTLVGGLVAQSLGVGLVEVRKNGGPAADSDQWRYRTTPPDYRDRHLRLGFPKRLLIAGERALFVDDWIDTGGQALGVWNLVRDAGATWVGAAVIVDGLDEPQIRRDLDVRSLLRARDL
jgi:adenine phosphoribosyltransferase